MNKAILRDLRSWRFIRRFSMHLFSGVGALAIIAGLIDVFFVGELSKMAWSLWLIVITSVAYGSIRAWPRPIEQRYAAPNTAIRVIRGDLFDDPDTHLVIGFSDTFDTTPPFIAPNSVQGQFLVRVYGGNAAGLDADIDEQLAMLAPKETLSKPGKTARYELGTVLTLRTQERRYFLVAYSTMDARNTASSTSDGMWSSLSNLWGQVRAEGNGTRVSIPVIGGGQSKLSPVLPAQDAIRFIALSFMLASRSQKVCDELQIVATPREYDRLDRLEIQAFLSSLKPS